MPGRHERYPGTPSSPPPKHSMTLRDPELVEEIYVHIHITAYMTVTLGGESSLVLLLCKYTLSRPLYEH